MCAAIAPLEVEMTGIGSGNSSRPSTAASRADTAVTQPDFAPPILPPLSSTVSVVVRVRPMSMREAASGSQNVIACDGQVIKLIEDPSVTLRGAHADKTFAFDAVLPPETTQAEVYHRTGAQVLMRVLQGYNGCIFAYGQTGSGKTYTMEGGPAPEQRGIMSRLVTSLFEGLEAQTKLEWTCSATYLEVYQDVLRDLLAGPQTIAAGSSRPPTGGSTTPAPGSGAAAMSPTPRKGPTPVGSRSPAMSSPSPGGATSPPPAAGLSALAAAAGGPVIRESVGGDIFVEGATSWSLTCAEQVAELLREGSTRRTTSETAMNAVSSRSHAILTISLNTRQVDDELGLTAHSSKLHLIDLAGSERSDTAQTSGARLREGAKINQSLSALGNVINALTSATVRTHVPYRDSKLTRLLQDSLGGNSYTLMVLCVSPASVNAEESMSSLRFGERAKKVRNVARVNVDPMAAKYALLLAENARLQQRIGVLEEEVRVLRGASPTPRPTSTPLHHVRGVSSYHVGTNTSATALPSLQQLGAATEQGAPGADTAQANKCCSIM